MSYIDREILLKEMDEAKPDVLDESDLSALAEFGTWNGCKETIIEQPDADVVDGELHRECVDKLCAICVMSGRKDSNGCAGCKWKH